MGDLCFAQVNHYIEKASDVNVVSPQNQRVVPVISELKGRTCHIRIKGSYLQLAASTTDNIKY